MVLLLLLSLPLRAAETPRIAVVPGCPVEEDGSLSTCLSRRIVWGSMLYEQGEVEGFITSGSAVYTPYVEAEALAAGLVALGVPEDRIWLDPHALHTDENMYNAMTMAQDQGWELVVASDGIHARTGCRMIRSWEGSCTSLRMPYPDVYARIDTVQAQLDTVQPRRVEDWRTLSERHRARKEITGRRRLPSLLLYPLDGMRRLVGDPRIPYTAEGAGSLLPWSSLRASQAPASTGSAGQTAAP